VVRYRSRVDVERGCKEGATVAAHIGGLRGAGTWLSPAEVEGDANIPHTVPKPPPHMRIKRAKAFVDDAGIKVSHRSVKAVSKRSILWRVRQSAMSVERARSVDASA